VQEQELTGTSSLSGTHKETYFVQPASAILGREWKGPTYRLPTVCEFTWSAVHAFGAQQAELLQHYVHRATDTSASANARAH